MMPAFRGQRPRLQRFHGKRIQKFARRFGAKQCRSYSIVFHEPGQCADTDQVIIDQLLRYSDHEDQARARSVCAKGNAGAAAPDTKNDFVHQIRARMRESDAMLHHAGVGMLAREHLFEKSFCIDDLSILRQQLGDFAQCVRRFAGAQSQYHLFFIE